MEATRRGAGTGKVARGHAAARCRLAATVQGRGRDRPRSRQGVVKLTNRGRVGEEGEVHSASRTGESSRKAEQPKAKGLNVMIPPGGPSGLSSGRVVSDHSGLNYLPSDKFTANCAWLATPNHAFVIRDEGVIPAALAWCAADEPARDGVLLVGKGRVPRAIAVGHSRERLDPPIDA